MKFSVTLSARASRDVEVEADSPEKALEVAKAKLGELLVEAKPESLEVISEGELFGFAWDVVGPCELCSRPILDDDSTPAPYVSSEDGGYAHRECPRG